MLKYNSYPVWTTLSCAYLLTSPCKVTFICFVNLVAINLIFFLWTCQMMIFQGWLQWPPRYLVWPIGLEVSKLERRQTLFYLIGNDDQDWAVYDGHGHAAQSYVLVCQSITILIEHQIHSQLYLIWFYHRKWFIWLWWLHPLQFTFRNPLRVKPRSRCLWS